MKLMQRLQALEKRFPGKGIELAVQVSGEAIKRLTDEELVVLMDFQSKMRANPGYEASESEAAMLNVYQCHVESVATTLK